MDDLGVLPFQETSIYIDISIIMGLINPLMEYGIINMIPQIHPCMDDY